MQDALSRLESDLIRDKEAAIASTKAELERVRLEADRDAASLSRMRAQIERTRSDAANKAARRASGLVAVIYSLAISVVLCAAWIALPPDVGHAPGNLPWVVRIPFDVIVVIAALLGVAHLVGGWSLRVLLRALNVRVASALTRRYQRHLPAPHDDTTYE